MSKNLGIGFVTGRSNVCKIINSYYEDMLKQTAEYDVKLTIYILYDLHYLNTKVEEFYKIDSEVLDKINVKYITPEVIENEMKFLASETILTEQDTKLIFGNGHAKGRNTIMYFAYKEKMDYLLFWDDDEYPVANIKNANEIIWKKQNNISKHLNYISDADVTIGYHCGYISPIPYININNDIKENILKKYIEAISNDILSWDSFKNKMQLNYGISYADEKILNSELSYEIPIQGAGKWVSGSTLCLNLNHIDKIPAFYNPPDARGEDTFFSTMLDDSKVIKVPVYHFHDGFLKYTDIMDGKFPYKLEKIDNSRDNIVKRFFSASRGWIRYKPLLMYISDPNQYDENIKLVYEQLNDSIPGINKLFKNFDFTELIDNLKEYDKNVKVHYEQYQRTNAIWKILKNYLHS